MSDLREIVAAEDPLGEVLHRVAVGAAQVIVDADAVTITVFHAGTPDTAAWTDDRYLDIDRQQYSAGRGPCLDAARTGRSVRAGARAHRDAWPEFSAAAEQVGVSAYLSVPLLLAAVGQEPELVGSFNMYSHDVAGFDSFDETLMRVFSVAVEQAVTNARRWQRSREQVSNLEIALESRAEIDYAKGILMGAYRCTATEAFEMLVKQSRQRNVKLRQVARELIASVGQRSAGSVARPRSL